MQRRSFLVMATLASGGLLAGCASPARQDLRQARLALKIGEVALNGWLTLSPEGVVTLMMPKAEMGQGVYTGLIQIVAEELDCTLAQIRLQEAPIDPLYGAVVTLAEGVPFRPDDDGVLARGMRWALTATARQVGLMMTGGSGSIRDLWEPLRQAAAATRATLVEAVARHWQLSPAAVELIDGRFAERLGPGVGAGAGAGRQLGLGEAVRLLWPHPQLAARVVLKPAGDYRQIGRPLARVDAAPKSDGRAVFAIDVRPPGLLYAALRMAPVRGGRVRSVQAEAARALPGVAGVVVLEPMHGSTGGVAVVAERWWTAQKALAALKVDFEDGPMQGLYSHVVMRTLRAALDGGGGFTYWKQGDTAAARATAARTLQADYSAPYLAHATLEPMNATVAFHGDRAEVWAGTQVPGLARRAAARAIGLDEERVEMHVSYLGGGFGRRLEVDVVAQAATVAKAFPGRAVQLIWRREDDFQHDFYRPAVAARLSAALDAQGRITAWEHVSAGQAITPGYLPRTVGLPVIGPDKTTSEGAFDAAYEFPAVRVRHLTQALPVPVGFWRSVGHSAQAFFKESFLDECAHAAGADPLAYRLALLQRHPRQRAVLELAAQKAGWGRPLPPAADGAPRARGLALHESFGAVVAHVAEVSLDATGRPRVHRIVAAIDCGRALNPNLIAQQMDSAVVFGLSAALHGRIDIEAGRIAQRDFAQYRLIGLADCPAIETHIVASEAAPEGVGEPGVPPVAPAVANALYLLTGERLRALPFRLA